MEAIATLPGIGKRTALRLALHLVKQEQTEVERLASAIVKLKTGLQHCKTCHNISDQEFCSICSSPVRKKHTICVVEDIRDVMAIENTGQYQGLYHVLGGTISPMEGVMPDDLTINALIDRVTHEDIKEVIFALSTTIEGDTTSYYIYKQIIEHVNTISVIARGIAVGDNIEYADEVTLGRSINQRHPFAETNNV